MASLLSPYQLKKARNNYQVFNILTALSYQFIIGNIIIIFALKIGASSLYIGILNGLNYISWLFLPLGKLLAERFSIIGVYSKAWIIRSLSMIPVLMAPFFSYHGYGAAALKMMVLGVAAFHIARSIGSIGSNPVIRFLTSGPDRGSYLTYMQIINNGLALAAGLVIALVLGREPHIFVYAGIFAVGIITGILSGLYLQKLPEPRHQETGKEIKFADVLKQALNTPALRNFIGILFTVSLVSGAARAFIVVYSRQIFGQSDGLISFYSVIGSTGTVLVGMAVMFLIDRAGAKPLFFISLIIGIAGMVPVLFFPVDSGKDVIFAYMIFLFFFVNFGFAGNEGIGTTYFVTLVPEELILDLSILQWYCYGIAGAIGSFLSGFLLDTLAGAGISQILSFKIFFLILIGVSISVLFMQKKMVSLGAMPFKNVLGMIFSFNELKTLFLLGKLEKSRDPEDEEVLLDALRESPSDLAVRDLFSRASSPLLSIRLEALRTIDSLKKLDASSEKALMDDITVNPFTTAYYSARILGNHGSTASIPILREAAFSGDYMLSGESLIALARLGDWKFRTRIEEIITSSDNPRLKIMGVEALGIYGSPDSLSVLLDVLRRPNPPPYLRDEVFLAIAAILGVQKGFYLLMDRYRRDESLIRELSLDEVESAIEYCISLCGRGLRKKKPQAVPIRNRSEILRRAASDYIASQDGAALCRWILELPDNCVGTVTKVILSELTVDDKLSGYSRLRLLIVHWAALELKRWAESVLA
jgi:MFS family permease